MKRQILNLKQGSTEWHKARLGRATSSKFADILKTGRSKSVEWGDTAMKYMYQLAAERFTGTWEEIHGKPLEWGTDMEPLAIKAYEEKEWANVSPVGFIQLGDLIGSSTDGLVGVNGMIEVKSPYCSKNHIDYLINGAPKQYIPQIQGGLWVADREWCDFISFDPRFIKKSYRLSVHRYYRDEDYIKNLESRVLRFIEILEETIAKIELIGLPALKQAS